MDNRVGRLLSDALADRGCGFSVGGFGALAEFQDETARSSAAEDGALLVVSPRGALRIAATAPVSALAYEALAASPDTWQCGVGVVGDAGASTMGARAVLSELGPDDSAIDAAQRGIPLFDLGAGLPHVDFCVRTADTALQALLRAYVGRPVIADGHPVMEAVIDASPHRVVSSRLARIEVYQRIDRHQTPSGPHTHLLPSLLQRRRTHSANVPIPRGRVPLLTLHPEHPLMTADGRRRPFDRRAWERFETLLERFGDDDYVREKRRLMRAVAESHAPEHYAPARSRVGRLAQRVALRQLAHTLPDPAAREPWLARFRT